MCLALLPVVDNNIRSWDTAGQERFRTLTSSYYRGSNGVILVYDVSSRESFESITNTWFPELDTYTPAGGLITMIVGNKVDKSGDRMVSRDEGLELARSRGALFMECSAKSSKFLASGNNYIQLTPFQSKVSSKHSKNFVERFGKRRRYGERLPKIRSRSEVQRKKPQIIGVLVHAKMGTCYVRNIRMNCMVFVFQEIKSARRLITAN
jgi:small GTP-binding protein